MKRCILFSVLVGFLCAITASLAAGLIIIEDSSLWPGPVPPHPLPPPSPPWHWPQPHVFAPLQVDYVKANTHIIDQVAVTIVDEEFYNPNNARLEGTFVFPIPKGAQLDKFTMEIDGRQVEAELLPAGKARHIYEEIVRKLRDPALLEYANQDVFKVRIFPIESNSKKRITLSYTQLLKSDNGLVSFLLPLSADKFSCRPIPTVSVKVDLETRRPLKTVYSPSHKIEVKRNGPNRATVGYEATDVLPEADLALYFAPERGELGLNLLTHKCAGEDGYFLLLASPGIDTKDRRIVNKDVVFALDTSGSMAGKKIEQAKKALEFCVENLNDGDRFELIRFSTDIEPLFNSLVEANAKNRTRAEEFVKDLKAIGATDIDDALKQALGLQSSKGAGDRPFMVIFLTDGRPTIGTTDEGQILTNVKDEDTGKARIFCFGIGTDVNAHLLDQITEETRGASQYVLPEEDLEFKLSAFFEKVKEPVLTNPALQFTGGLQTKQLYPSPLPDLFKGEQLVLVGRYSGHGDSAMLLEGTVNGAVRKFTYEGNFPQENSGNDFIPRLWATRRVGYLLDEIRLHGENSELRDEVTQLARKYGIVTPYTAYLIAEDESRRDVPSPLRLLQEFGKDPEARQDAARSWQTFTREQSGDAGVASAQSSLALKMADAAAPAQMLAGQAFQRRYGLAPGGPALSSTADSSQTPRVDSAQQSRFVAGRTFFRNESGWVGSIVQNFPQARHIRLQFGSREYFDFLGNHPQAASWLALGQNLQFVLDGVIYEIYE